MIVCVYEDSSGKSEEEHSSNLRLPLGISLPSLFVLCVGGWYGWKYCTKPKRNSGSASNYPSLLFEYNWRHPTKQHPQNFLFSWMSPVIYI